MPDAAVAPRPCVLVSPCWLPRLLPALLRLSIVRGEGPPPSVRQHCTGRGSAPISSLALYGARVRPSRLFLRQHCTGRGSAPLVSFFVSIVRGEGPPLFVGAGQGLPAPAWRRCVSFAYVLCKTGRLVFARYAPCLFAPRRKRRNPPEETCPATRAARANPSERVSGGVAALFGVACAVSSDGVRRGRLWFAPVSLKIRQIHCTAAQIGHNGSREPS